MVRKKDWTGNEREKKKAANGEKNKSLENYCSKRSLTACFTYAVLIPLVFFSLAFICPNKHSYHRKNKVQHKRTPIKTLPIRHTLGESEQQTGVLLHHLTKCHMCKTTFSTKYLQTCQITLSDININSPLLPG